MTRALYNITVIIEVHPQCSPGPASQRELVKSTAPIDTTEHVWQVNKCGTSEHEMRNLGIDTTEHVWQVNKCGT